MSGAAGLGKVAFVLGGGGLRGGYEVGMYRALLRAGIEPDFVVGTSIGSVNGAMIAADPTTEGYLDMVDLWRDIVEKRIFRVAVHEKVVTLMRTRSHLASNEPLRELLQRYFGGLEIGDLRVRFSCAGASIEKAAAHWFDQGPLIPALMASCAVPGLWPPVEIDGEHFLDGGLVESIPVSRAIAEGATTVFVMHAGRINQPLRPPKWVWQAAAVSLEIARRQTFFGALQNLPEDVTVHVLPTGDTAPDEDIDLFDTTAEQHVEVRTRIDNGYRATWEYLEKAL